MTQRIGPLRSQKDTSTVQMNNPRKHARGIVVEVTCPECGKTARVVLRKIEDALKLKCTNCEEKENNGR